MTNPRYSMSVSSTTTPATIRRMAVHPELLDSAGEGCRRRTLTMKLTINTTNAASTAAGYTPVDGRGAPLLLAPIFRVIDAQARLFRLDEREEGRPRQEAIIPSVALQRTAPYVGIRQR